MSNGNVRLVGVVTGMVQGVSFRWFTQHRAQDYGLTGYVRNLPDGGVEFVAEGLRADLERLLDVVRVGPAAAVVENVETGWTSATGEYVRFEIRF